jgi:hypothetical protein
LLPTVPVTISVTDSAGLFDPAALVGTTVRLSGKVGGGGFVVEREVDAAGQAAVEVPAESYVLSVVPPAESAWGIVQRLVEIENDKGAAVSYTVALDPKSSMHGHVRDHAGGVVPEAHVVATFMGKGAYPDTAPLPARKYDTYSNDEGYYEILLDVGEYQILVEPPEETGLPRRLVRNVFVNGSHQRPLELAAPVAVTGMVQGYVLPAAVAVVPREEGMPAPAPAAPALGPAEGVRVEFYDQTEGAREGEGVLPVPLAEAWTDADGRYVLIMPAVVEE